MPRRPRSKEEDDPSLVALQAQKRILQLKRERDERIQAVVEKTDAAMADLRSRIMEQHEQNQRQIAKQRAQSVMNIVELVERREDIEVEMADTVVKTHAIVRELEEMMLTGYDGRLADAKASKDRLRGQRT
ncbi:hypothetical protein PT974_08987 [Cladobotryum mycophilum]|uniref:Uncharacterized protein n=1 Tax=Cladobotryum mycophilum TaxID=491253 RepID=A0ABR0SEY7_9HYPO